jgi:hypothetical protein
VLSRPRPRRPRSAAVVARANMHQTRARCSPGRSPSRSGTHQITGSSRAVCWSAPPKRVRKALPWPRLRPPPRRCRSGRRAASSRSRAPGSRPWPGCSNALSHFAFGADDGDGCRLVGHDSHLRSLTQPWRASSASTGMSRARSLARRQDFSAARHRHGQSQLPRHGGPGPARRSASGTRGSAASGVPTAERLCLG